MLGFPTGLARGTIHMSLNHPDEIVQRGQELYDRMLRPQLEAGHRGKYLVINVDTGEYEMDADDLTASKRARSRFGSARMFTMRIGYPAAYWIGVSSRS